MFSMTEFGAAKLQSRTASTGNASPQNRLSRNRGYNPGLSSPSRRMNIAVDGTENQAVNRAALMKEPCLIICFCVGTQRHAPADHVTNRSCADKSKVRSNVCDKRSVFSIPYLFVTWST